ncbi:hypothetical protein DPMN_054120 [Dreissena polymorpha]|uniref:Macro domain-containing protein n=1 Tax=Dreissena polymorpha TaxID=45954 RepID=A0A9D4HST4_DREPO|nr:hypothetical protein DPMN_054120 [Dreissena polymorpha]
MEKTQYNSASSRSKVRHKKVSGMKDEVNVMREVVTVMGKKTEVVGEEVKDLEEVSVIYKFCDIQDSMVSAWNVAFKQYIPECVQVYHGDIFKDGPAADAIVSPANSFGFMDGGIDMAYSLHFGWQMQKRLQEKIRSEFDGEVLVGQAAIITSVENNSDVVWSQFNEGQPIRYLISAPTMRVPLDVSDTPNAYLAFRAVILAVQKFNRTAPKPIRSVLCPGLGTAIGLMPHDRCAHQMLRAFETFYVGKQTDILRPRALVIANRHHWNLTQKTLCMMKVCTQHKDRRICYWLIRPCHLIYC